MANYFDFSNENWLALLVAIVANFVIGFVWYAPWFPTGKMWMKHMGLTPDHKPAQGEMMKGMVMMLVGAFLLMLVMGHFIPKGMGASLGDDKVNYAFSTAVLWWAGFQVPMILGSVGWEKKAVGHGVINAGYQLVSMVVAAMIFVYM